MAQMLSPAFVKKSEFLLLSSCEQGEGRYKGRCGTGKAQPTTDGIENVETQS
jgi:hypothetical protein